MHRKSEVGCINIVKTNSFICNNPSYDRHNMTSFLREFIIIYFCPQKIGGTYYTFCLFWVYDISTFRDCITIPFQWGNSFFNALVIKAKESRKEWKNRDCWSIADILHKKFNMTVNFCVSNTEVTNDFRRYENPGASVESSNLSFVLERQGAGFDSLIGRFSGIGGGASGPIGKSSGEDANKGRTYSNVKLPLGINCLRLGRLSAPPIIVSGAFGLLGLIVGILIIAGSGRMLRGNNCGLWGLPGNWPRPHWIGAMMLVTAVMLWVVGCVYLPVFFSACV